MNRDGYDGRNAAEQELQMEEVAERAVRKVFAILGVDVDDPEKVEEFRKSLRWSDSMRKMADHGWMAIVGIVAVGMAAALWSGIVGKLGGGK